MQDVTVFKIASGEEIICVVKEDTDALFVVEKVRSIAPQEHEGGQISLRWMPFLWMDVEGNATIELYKSTLMGRMPEAEIPRALRDEYTSKTSSIVIAGAGDIK